MKNVRSWMLLFGLFAVLAFSALGKAEAYKTIVLPPGVSSVGEEAFSDDAAITAVVIPGGVSIADSAFSGCVNLRSLIILEGADLPFGQIFSQLPIENVYCPPESKAYAYFKDKNVNLFTLGEYRADEHFLTDFRLSGAVITGYTGADASVRIPSRILGMPVIEIGDRAFYENTAVEEVFIPNTVMTIGEKGFFACPSLKKVQMEGKIDSIGARAFQNCERLSEIQLVSGLTFVGDYAFRNCRSLKDCVLPESVVSQGEGVFRIDPLVHKGILSIVPLYQFNYTKTVCVFGGEEKSVKTSGCGATCVAMAIRYMRGDYEVSPQTVFEWAYKTGYYKGDGLSHLALSRALSLNGVKNRWTRSSSEVMACLKEGRPVIAHMGPGMFAENGHYILLKGVDENGLVVVNDPNSRALTDQAFPIELIKSQLKVSDGFCLIRE